jgi:pilus assembly protein CpaE
VFEGLGYPPDKIRWVVNRHRPGTTLALRDLQRALGTERIATLPNQYEVATAAISQGLPVAEVAPRSALLRSLQALAEPASQAPQADSTPSWWGRWLQAAPVAR